VQRGVVCVLVDAWSPLTIWLLYGHELVACLQLSNFGCQRLCGKHVQKR
jgi:hypothetical protein